jgi:CO/xanthine dehydrogenase FAD-binding subunit
MTNDLRPLPQFDYVSPGSLAEVINLLSEHGTSAKLLAGGTDLLPRMKRRRSSPRVVIDLNSIVDLSFIAVRDNALRIGAGTRLAVLYDSSVIRDKAAALADAIHVMSSPGIRNRATIGGNLCNAARCADTPAPLLALDACVKLLGPDSERNVPIRSFFTAPGNDRRKTVLRPDEVMTEVIIPLQTGNSTFLKLGRRRGSSTSIISAAAFVVTANGKFKDVRIAVSAFGLTPIRSEKVEMALMGAPVNKKTIEQAAAKIKDEIKPITDIRASAAYRTDMAAVLIERVVTRLAIGGL